MDTIWTTDKVETQYSDKGFYAWDVISQVWSGFGCEPFPKTRKVLANKRQLKEFNGKTLPTPRFIN
jgi:hypothetical protein